MLALTLAWAGALSLAAFPCATAHSHRPPQPHLAVRAAAASSSSSSSNSTSSLVPAVCTPDLCLEGQNALTAGVVVSSPVNGSTQRITLLPGTYTPSSSALSSSNSSLSSALFSRRASAKPSNGFSSSGSLASGSSFTVQMMDGVTAYTNALYQGEATYLSLPTNSTSNSSSNSTYPSTQIHSLLFSPSSSLSLYTILSTPSSPHLILWSSLPDFSQTKSLAAGAKVVDVQNID
ncbi:EGF-like domain-containing protein [Rhodotorula toruloides]|nr:EGF-like domain-containing protein [Rhodotorula toruloides]